MNYRVIEESQSPTPHSFPVRWKNKKKKQQQQQQSDMNRVKINLVSTSGY